jgi:hypothetical protein
MKTIKTIIPEGWEIDKQKSTFEEIVLKQSKKQLPKRWEDLELAPHFATQSQLNAINALRKLSQLREVYRGGWKPEILGNRYSPVFAIIFHDGKLDCLLYYTTLAFLIFQSEQVAKEFLTNFRELIIEAAPLLFGEEIK